MAPAPASTANKAWGVAVTIVTIIAAALAIYVLVTCWGPVVGVAGVSGKPTIPTIRMFGKSWANPTVDTLYVVVVLAMGAIGGSIHILTSAATYIGNNRFYKRWIPWYLVRMPVGMSLALILYMALRGGLLTASTSTADINPYGIAAIAALGGLFSKQATDKLEQVFNTLFQSTQGGDTQRENKNPQK